MEPKQNPTERFTTRVANYVRYRPEYPSNILTLLASRCGLTPESSIADIGSGTGLLAKLFLRNGNTVYGVEPNDAMRIAGEQTLKNYAKFISIKGTAEATSLPSASVDFVTAGQAFHWFEPTKARAEFCRILKPKAWVALIWNERRLDSTPFLRAYEQLLLTCGTDYQEIRHDRFDQGIGEFFAPAEFSVTTFENVQQLDWDALKGRVFSASYTPEPDHHNYEEMVAGLEKIFRKHCQNGMVEFEYNTKVYFGQLPERLK